MDLFEPTKADDALDVTFPQPLQGACLLRRYQRFLADVRLDEGTEITLHCPNTGRMTGCGEPGWRVWFSLSDNPARKYPGTWELAQTPDGDWIGVNTSRANAVVAAALHAGRIPELTGYHSLRREVPYGEERSRIDLLLTAPDQASCYIEVKSVTLLGDPARPSLAVQGHGFFPDAPSARASKHLRELIRLRQQGQRALVLFCVLHTGIRQVSAAQHVDADYALALQQAVEAGVEVLAYACAISPLGLRLGARLPVMFTE